MPAVPMLFLNLSFIKYNNNNTITFNTCTGDLNALTTICMYSIIKSRLEACT